MLSPKDKYTLTLIAVMSICTIILRFLPFVVFKDKKTPPYVDYLGRVLPYAVMAMLVIYCMKGVSLIRYPHALPELIAGVLTAAVFVKTKNTLASIIPGTICYMLLIQVVFK